MTRQVRLDAGDKRRCAGRTGPWLRPLYGARPLKRAIQSELENPLAKEILSGRFAPKDTIRIDAQGGKFVFAKGETAAVA